jgi:hypothetical protein
MGSRVVGRTDETVEYCETCGGENRHRVTIGLASQGDRESNARFAREPHRNTHCDDCGTERTVRVAHGRQDRSED